MAEIRVERVDDPDQVFQELAEPLRESYVEMFRDPTEVGSVDSWIFLPGYGELYAAYADEELVGCAGWTWLFTQTYRPDEIAPEWPRKTVQLKRMFVKKEWRRQGIASMIDDRRFEGIWEAGAELAIGETGGPQSASKRMHNKPGSGYVIVEPFGEFKDNPMSLFFGKWRPE